MMMMWGFIPFSLKDIAYDELENSVDYNVASNARVGKRPSQQFTGLGDDVITLTGTLLPLVTGGRADIAMLKAQADLGLSLPLLEGGGKVYGFYKVTSLRITERLQIATGEPKEIGFSITFIRDGDDFLDYSAIGNGMRQVLSW